MIVVVGGGAAGLLAAIAAAERGSAVRLLERTPDGGRKILISGGGRCNVLPSTLAPDRFVTDSPRHLLRGMLRSWPLGSQHAYFERELGLPLVLEADTGKWFPASNRARDVRDALVTRARSLGVDFTFDTIVTNVRPSGDGWRLEVEGGELRAGAVVLATGGLSVRKTGSDGLGLRVAAALGHCVHETFPALTPLTAAGGPHAHLSGVSVFVRLRARSAGRTTESSGGFLFTHRGYSGPAVLDLSHIVARRRPAEDPARLHVRWAELEASAWHRELAGGHAQVVSAVARHVPARLAAQLLFESGVPTGRQVSELRKQERLRLIERLVACPLPVTGDEGYAKAEVTGGGVSLDEVDARTLESRRHRGLFLCGEMLDAFGPIGGHNFAWAWATGRLAGIGAADFRRAAS